MRNKIIGNAAAVLNALGSECITRAELERRLEAAGVTVTPDSLSNILSDLQELMWVERRLDAADQVKYRIGLGLAFYWTRAKDRERMEMSEIAGRVRALVSDNSAGSPEELAARNQVVEMLMKIMGAGKGKIR